MQTTRALNLDSSNANNKKSVGKHNFDRAREGDGERGETARYLYSSVN